MSGKIGGGRVSGEAVRAKTGRDWEEWFTILDATGAASMGHKEIVALLAEGYDLGGWWQQMVTVTYEKARGLRDEHQKADGYQIGGSKTVAVPVESLFAAWVEPEQRRVWLGVDTLTVHRSTPTKSLRARWTEDDSRVEANFYAAGDGKSRVSVSHGRLRDAAAASRMKAFWKERLARLAESLAAG